MLSPILNTKKNFGICIKLYACCSVVTEIALLFVLSEMRNPFALAPWLTMEFSGSQHTEISKDISF